MKSVRSLNVTLDFCPDFPVANVFWRSPLKGPRSEANWHSRVRQSVCVKCSKTRSKSLPTCWISKYQMEPTGRRARKELQPMRPDTALLSPPVLCCHPSQYLPGLILIIMHLLTSRQSCSLTKKLVKIKLQKVELFTTKHADKSVYL